VFITVLKKASPLSSIQSPMNPLQPMKTFFKDVFQYYSRILGLSFPGIHSPWGFVAKTFMRFFLCMPIQVHSV
jgi:hypothetical protein